MSIRPKAPLDTITSTEMNADLFGLASGENDDVGNSLSFYRKFIGNFIVGGALTPASGINMNLGALEAVINGVYYAIPAQTLQSQGDGVTAVDLSATGLINLTFAERGSNPAHPPLEADSIRIAVLDATNEVINSIRQTGVDAYGNPLAPRGAVNGENVTDKSMPVAKLKDFVVARDVRMSCAPGWNKETVTLPKGQKMSSTRYAVLATMNGEYVNGGQGSARFQLGIAYSISQTQVVVYVYNSYNRTLSCGVNLICSVET